MNAKDDYDVNSEFRLKSRTALALAWRARRDGRIDELSDEMRRFAKVMAEHSEWYQLWEAADDDVVGDSDIITSEGANPFAQVAVEAAGEGLIAEHPEGRLTYRHFLAEGSTHKDARAEICRAFMGSLWWADKAVGEGKPSAVYPLADLNHVFKRMRSGESAENIFASEE